MNKTAKLIAFAFAITLPLFQSTLAFIYHVDVLAKVIKMTDGTDKVDVAIIGSDDHNRGTTLSNLQLLLNFARHFDPKNNSVEMFIENPTSQSQFYLSDNAITQKRLEDEMILRIYQTCLDDYYSYKFTLENSKVSPLETFSLSVGSYNKIKKFLDPNIEWGNFFNRIHNITNLEVRPLIILGAIPPDIAQDYNAFQIQHLSKNYFNQMLALLDGYIEQSDNEPLAEIFRTLKVRCQNGLESFSRNILEEFKEYSDTPSEPIAYDHIINEIFQRGYAEDREDLNEIIREQKPLYQMIDANALWKISQSQIRISNRTITLIGGAHANPEQSQEGRIESQGEGLVANLQAIGYVKLESFTLPPKTALIEAIPDEIKKKKEPNQEDLTFIQQYFNRRFCEDAAQIAHFMLKWINSSDNEVRANLHALSTSQ